MTYEELVAASRAYADRNDLEVVNNVNIFIVMAEARMNRVLKTRKQSARAYTPTVTNQEYYSLPPDYAGMRDIQLNSTTPSISHTSCAFSYLAPEIFNERRNNPEAGKLYYCIIANQIQIFPVQDAGSTIEMIYFQKVQPLTEEANTNWMSIDHPDIYLSGIVAEIELFAKNYETSKLWDARMTRAIEELDSSDIKERWSGSQLTMRTA